MIIVVKNKDIILYFKILLVIFILVIFNYYKQKTTK
jgi:hypothetical protein